MPQFTPKTVSDPSNLTHGRHPGFLLAITEEPIPDGWAMGAKDTLMFRWHLAIWEHIEHLAQYAPEQQSAISSRAFSPKGKFQQSKAHAWASALIGHEIPKGQGVDLDPLLPIACYVDVERTPGNDYCKITALWGRPEGQGAIPPVVHQLRQQYVTVGTPAPQAQLNGQAPLPPPPAPPAQQQPPPPRPVAWGSPGPAPQPPQGQQPVLPGTRPAGNGAPF